MEERNQSQMQDPNRSPLLPENMRVRKKVWVIAAAAVAIIILIGGYFVWANYWSPEAQKQRQLQKNIDKYTSAMKTFEDAMRADTYGGKTPQETLNMFIDALKKNDIELASKYFALDTNTKSPDYLTRNRVHTALNSFGSQKGFNDLTEILGRAQPSPSNHSPEDGDYEFITYASDGRSIETSVFMVLNKYSQVWKIESM